MVGCKANQSSKLHAYLVCKFAIIARTAAVPTESNAKRLLFCMYCVMAPPIHLGVW